MPHLDRFKIAQQSSAFGFASALAEIRSGGKRGHWIWYVFPQLEGLGTSFDSRKYAIHGRSEAREFLQDGDLRRRLLTIAEAVAEQLRSGRGYSLRELMGSRIDALKVASSMTLFGRVARELHTSEGLEEYARLAEVADEILRAAVVEGGGPCTYTNEYLRTTE